MSKADRVRYLRIVLVIAGLTFTVGVYPLTIVWPSGWTWHGAGRSDYLEMIFGIYATLGVFLILAAREPLEHLSLIWFTVWSSIAHGAIMAAQALVNSRHIGHLLGDVPALFVVAGILAALTPRRKKPAVADLAT